jgi:Cu+-exporting ATPase
MFRRKFVQLIAAAGTSGVASLAVAETKLTKTSTYLVKGFSCVTCAVGLDAILQKQKGVTWCKSEYPSGTVTIKFDPQELDENALKTLIGEMGFEVTEVAVLPGAMK